MYSTTDLCEATMISLYYPLKDINHLTQEYIFEIDTCLQALLSTYEAGDCVVEPHIFYEHLEELRMTMNSVKTIYL